MSLPTNTLTTYITKSKDEFQRIRGHFTLQDPSFEPTGQGTFERMIEDFYVIVEEMPEVLEKIEALKAHKKD